MTVTRGTTNTNQRGNTKDRAARRAYLLETYAADVKLVRVYWDADNFSHEEPEPHLSLFHGLRTEEVPTARCYRCGTLLHDGTITVDRIIPGAHGGTYARNNIRPACGPHNSSTGATVRRKR